jgi:uncharacterized protein (TIRG00374 family)
MSSKSMLKERTNGVVGVSPNVGTGKWHLWIGLVFSLGCLVLALRDVDLGKIVVALQQVNLLIVALAAISNVVTILAKAARWRALLVLRKTPSLGQAFSVLSIGMLVNSFAPGRIGELVRAFLLGESESESKVYILSTIVVEKTTDLVFLMLSVALLLSQMALPDWLTGPARALAITIVILIPVLLLLAWQSSVVLRAVGRISNLIAPAWQVWLVQKTGLGLEGLQIIQNPRVLFGLFTWSVLIWIISVLTNYLVFGAMGMVQSGWAALLLLVVLQAGVAVPSSPGRIGVFQYLAVLALGVFSIDKELAFGYSVVLYIVVYVPIAIVGAYCLWRSRITWQRLITAATAVSRLLGEPK